MNNIQDLKKQLAEAEQTCAALRERIMMAEHDDACVFPIYKITNFGLHDREFVIQFVSECIGMVIFTRINSIGGDGPGCQHFPYEQSHFVSCFDENHWRDVKFSSKRRLPDDEIVVGWSIDSDNEYQCAVGAYNVDTDTIRVVQNGQVSDLKFDHYNPVWESQGWQ